VCQRTDAARSRQLCCAIEQRVGAPIPSFAVGGRTAKSFSRCSRARLAIRSEELVMKWAGMYLVGFVFLVGGILAALWKLGILESIGTTWTLIGLVIAIGIGIMVSVANSGSKENIQIDRK
jgi:hypothetical protein